MEGYLAQKPIPNWAKAKAIYTTGAHSGAYAKLTVGATTAELAKGAAATQGSTATGKVKSKA